MIRGKYKGKFDKLSGLSYYCFTLEPIGFFCYKGRYMSKSRLPKSIKKFIRNEKARIRREFSDIAKQAEEIQKLYGKFIKKVA